MKQPDTCASEEVASGGVERARDLDLWLSAETSTLVVDRLPGRAAYPRQSGPARLFTLLPGQIGRYRANFRFTVTTCACNPSWYYEDWLILIANGETRLTNSSPARPTMTSTTASTSTAERPGHTGVNHPGALISGLRACQSWIRCGAKPSSGNHLALRGPGRGSADQLFGVFPVIAEPPVAEWWAPFNEGARTI